MTTMSTCPVAVTGAFVAGVVSSYLLLALVWGVILAAAMLRRRIRPKDRLL